MRRAALILGGFVLVAAAPAAPEVRKVALKDNVFSPVPQTAAPGDTVRFRWAGENPHSVKFTKVPRGADKPASCKIRVGGKCSRKVEKAGTYRFKCTIHGDTDDRMRGRIVVD